MSLQIPKSFQGFVSENGPFKYLPVEYRPPEGRKIIPPVEQGTWHKITDEDGLPETETGLWLTNFQEIFSFFGSNYFYGRSSITVFSPHGWFTEWLLGSDFWPTSIATAESERYMWLPKRINRCIVLEWILEKRKDWWITVDRRQEIRNWMKKEWKNRPRTRKLPNNWLELISCELLKRKEQKRIAELHRQWLDAKQGGGRSAAKKSTPDQNGKPT